MNIEDEHLATTTGSVTYPGSFEMRSTFCDSCHYPVDADAIGALGCDFAQKKCICPLGQTYLDSACRLKEVVLQNFNQDQCNWANTDVSTSSINTCICNNYWGGSKCETCSLSDCSANVWDAKIKGETCYTCAQKQGSNESLKPNSSCSRCECDSQYYRGHTCRCRAAIFDIKPRLSFGYPTGVRNITTIDLKFRSTAESIAPDLQGHVNSELFRQQLRMAIAYDLDIPMINVEIVHYWSRNLRIAISPWCAGQFTATHLIDHTDPTRPETYGAGVSANHILDILAMDSENKGLVEQLQNTSDDAHLIALAKLNSMKQSYIQRHGRSPGDNSISAQEQAYGPRFGPTGGPSTMDPLSNTSNQVFYTLMDKVDKLIQAPADLMTTKLLNSGGSGGSSSPVTTQIYFPGCGDSLEETNCARMASDPYATKPKDDSIIIIIVVIVVVAVVLLVSVAACLYCNSKKLCCFKTIAEYNERKKRKAAERGTRTGSGETGSNSASGGSAGSDKKGSNGADGSNSSHPHSNSASGGQITGAVYHGASGTGPYSDTRGSGSGSSSAGYSNPRSGSNSAGRPTPRRTSNGGRPSGSSGSAVEMSAAGSSRNPSRRASRGGRSRGASKMESSRVGGLRASRIGGQGGGSTPIDENTAEETELPLPVGWEKAVAQDGKMYYVNTETLTSQWTHPALPSEEKEHSADEFDDM